MPGFNIKGEGGGELNVGAAPSGKKDPLRDHRFKMTIFMGMDATSAPFYLLKDVDLPEKIIDTLEIKCPGATYKFAKSVNLGDLKLTFYGTQKLAAKIKELEKDIHDTNTGIGNFNKYLKDVELQMHDGQEEKMVNFKFKGCWISNTQWGSLSYGSSELKLITVMVKCNGMDVEAG